MNSQPLPSGWQADLDLAFERRSTGTVLSRNLHKGPLQVQKALYPEGRDTCHVAILHPPGGIAAGDRLNISARLQDGARALLTTPGATKWYRSDGDYARQQHHFSVSGDAVLEWLPRENIVFDGSNVSTSVDVTLSDSSQYSGWEIMSFGRRASGERWRRGNLQMRTSIRRAGRMLWSESAHLDAGGAFGESSVGLSGRTVCGTFVVAGENVGSELLAACREVRPTLAEARVGITRLPGVLIARYLGDSTEEGFDWFTGLWELLRPALTARAACAPRVWAC
jgi:urease accessory protein